MRDFRKVFETYGANYEETMPRFMGNEALYLRLLNMMFEDTNLQKLGEELDRGNVEAAFVAAHTLKGVVSNMGLTPLYEAVCVIVEPLRAGEQREDYAQLYQNICAEYQKVEKLRQELTGGEHA